MRIIGITGKKRAGKSTLARGLLHYYSASKELMLAGPLKSMVSTMLVESGVAERSEVYDYIEGGLKEEVIEELGASPRTIMQRLGTEGGQSISKDFWVRLLKLGIRKYYMADTIIVPDVRFDIEAQAIHELGGVVISVERPGNTSVDTHASEMGVQEGLIDIKLVNSGNEKDLLEAAVSALDPFNGPRMFTLEEIRALKPCHNGWRAFLKSGVGKLASTGEAVSYEDIARAVGFPYCMFMLCALSEEESLAFANMLGERLDHVGVHPGGLTKKGHDNVHAYVIGLYHQLVGELVVRLSNKLQGTPKGLGLGSPLTDNALTIAMCQSQKAIGESLAPMFNTKPYKRSEAIQGILKEHVRA